MYATGDIRASIMFKGLYQDATSTRGGYWRPLNHSSPPRGLTLLDTPNRYRAFSPEPTPTGAARRRAELRARGVRGAEAQELLLPHSEEVLEHGVLQGEESGLEGCATPRTGVRPYTTQNLREEGVNER